MGALELGMSAELPPAESKKFEGSESGTGNAGAKIFGNYELLEKIGQGGMGVVYRARQINLGRLVAVKLLPFGQFSREDLVQRFRTEAAAAAALRHPNIVAIHDVGEHEGQQYFSMDLIAGHTLAEAVWDQPVSARRGAVYVKTIAEAVQYAHEHGVLHRDLKPSNVLIDESEQPHITDFGLAKRLSSPDGGMESLELTFTGQVLGSPNFMSPEQAEGRPHAIGPAADIYSLGALLYHLLTRQPPF
ncbi:MAG: serine/threonine protein kinase, partial [Bryobacteraceae bacterium]|nr:serine/threonine protein kinase [Bryobacteraceae bacterium]